MHVNFLCAVQCSIEHAAQSYVHVCKGILSNLPMCSRLHAIPALLSRDSSLCRHLNFSWSIRGCELCIGI